MIALLGRYMLLMKQKQFPFTLFRDNDPESVYLVQEGLYQILNEALRDNIKVK